VDFHEDLRAGVRVSLLSSTSLRKCNFSLLPFGRCRIKQFRQGFAQSTIQSVVAAQQPSERQPGIQLIGASLLKEPQAKPTPCKIDDSVSYRPDASALLAAC
jgi:hypothetical protein